MLNPYLSSSNVIVVLLPYVPSSHVLLMHVPDEVCPGEGEPHYYSMLRGREQGEDREKEGGGGATVQGVI